MNAMRQSVAMSIFVFSVPLIVEQKFFKVCLFTLIAASFHYSGILILVSYLFARVKFNTLALVVGLCASFIFSLGNFSQIFLDIFVPGKFTFYAVGWEDNEVYQFLIRFIILIIFMLAGHFVVKEKWFSNVIAMYSLGFFFYIALMDAGMLATRFNLFFRILEIILFPAIVAKSKYLTNRVTFLFNCFYNRHLFVFSNFEQRRLCL